MAPWYHAGPGSDGALLDTEKLPRRERVTQGDRLMKAGLILSVDNLPVSASSVATGINNGGEISGYCWVFAIGESVMGIPFPGEVPATTRINVRRTPAGALIGTQPNGVVGVIKAGPASAPPNPAILNDVTTPWWNVTFPSGVSGWVGQIVLGIEYKGGKDVRFEQ